MTRYLTPSQYNQMVRQSQQKQRQAIDDYNRRVRTHNEKVNQAINNYNRQVNAHNARVRANRERLRSELLRFAQQGTASRYVTFRISVTTVQTAYERLEGAAASGHGLDGRYNEILDLSEREATNNIGLMNALTGNPFLTPGAVAPNEPESPLNPVLDGIQPELANRWRGALFALNPHNPDAARHFCTSAREIMTRILDARAPDDRVIATTPTCDRTQQGTPTRRAKIKYVLHLKAMEQSDLEVFADSDMDNVLQLFHVFNEGTHGDAGTFSLPQLQAIRTRVEDGLMYFSRLSQ
jgi:hypothetical protein